MKIKNVKPKTTYEIIKSTPSPLLNSLRDYKPKTFTPKKFKKKYQDAYKKDLRDYL